MARDDAQADIKDLAMATMTKGTMGLFMSLPGGAGNTKVGDAQ